MSVESLAPIAEPLWTSFVAEDVVLAESDFNELQKSTRSMWLEYEWSEAWLYHYATRDYPFVRMDTPDAWLQDEARMISYLNERPPPSLYQNLATEFSVPLQKLPALERPSTVLRSITKGARRGIPGLSLLFDVAFGERGKVNFGSQGCYLQKSVPSGGARHPTEVFLFSWDGLPIPAGLYHYNVQHHRLDLRKAGNFFNAAREATFDLFKKYSEVPVGLMVFTSVFSRSMWRYRDPRSWRAVPIDLGHAMMAFRQVSCELGFHIYTYQKFNDSAICELLQLNSPDQAPFYVSTLV
jgi:SagB-type dehydrogenase family enzyme